MTTTTNPRWTVLPMALGDAYVDLQRRAAAHPLRCPAPPFGLLPLDAALGVLCEGDLVLVGARDPAMRLSFLLHCALGPADCHLVAMVSLGQPLDRVARLVIAADGGIPLATLERGDLSRDVHWPAVADAVERHHQRRLALLGPPRRSIATLRTALQDLRSEYAELAMLVIDSLHLLDPADGDPLPLLAELAHEHRMVVLVGSEPEAATQAQLRGRVLATVQLPPLEPRTPDRSALRPVTVQVEPDCHGGVSFVRLEHDPRTGAWQEPERIPERSADPAPVSFREGKELDAIYSAACCCLLHEVGLAHHWDGQPHGPGRAWELPANPRLSDAQRLVVRVALDIWDNQGGVLLRDLRKLPAGMVADVGELIADTASGQGPIGWVERHLGDDWQRWMAAGRWHELLGAGWRELIGRPPGQTEPSSAAT